MKRQLTKQEKELESKGKMRNLKELKELQDRLNYNKDTIKLQMNQREFEDKWRPYLRNKKDSEDNLIIKSIEEEIDSKKQLIQIADVKLKEGVETPSGV